MHSHTASLMLLVTLMNSHSVVSHLKIIKVEKVQLYFGFLTNPLHFFYCAKEN